MVFGDSAMKEKLPKQTYKQFCETIAAGEPLTLELANAVANAMKDWACERGVTHFTHWFQPMTGITAEKHDSFLSPAPDGKITMEFSGKELIRGEPDASSFPSGGLRSTFEARGYTAWDPTSPAFIKDNTLCIPTAYCSYTGEALDKKTPLMRSMSTVNEQAMRIIKLFGVTDAKRVYATVGPEQEYFLVDKSLFDRRRDLLFTGRTLFGAKPPKGQEMEDHFFGAFGGRVLNYLQDLDSELWKLGVFVKTEHKEVAPGQYEMAPVFTTNNIATDHNQLVMELMKKVALRHDMVCLLHEKPFAGVNGSGKHNNWSLSTDTGVNLLEPGDTPRANARFLLFLSAVIKAVDEYQDLLRVSVASAGNDHRLGGNEAPPAIVSIFLGDQLAEVIEAIVSESDYTDSTVAEMAIGVGVLPRFPKDMTDRNRTSAFAFTGNKFEFRMPGSSFSISGPNVVLNTIVAESLRQFADTLEGSGNFAEALALLVRETMIKHRRIIFNGDGYTAEWEEEAKRRGLLNLKDTPTALAPFILEKNIALFERHKVFTAKEVHSRYEMLLEAYCKTLNIEATTMLDMARRTILPAVIKYTRRLAETVAAKKAISTSLSCEAEEALLSSISGRTACLYRKIEALDAAVLAVHDHKNDLPGEAVYFRDFISPAMKELRAVADELELLVDEIDWPLPTYSQLLFSVVS
jgi:glutamine synthetase